jgi:hypothetical protein
MSPTKKLFTVVGNRRTAGMLFKKARGLLFNLVHAMPPERGFILRTRYEPLRPEAEVRFLTYRVVMLPASRKNYLSPNRDS